MTEEEKLTDSVVDILIKGMRNDIERLKWVVDAFYEKQYK